jgi:hypothetical protein
MGRAECAHHAAFPKTATRWADGSCRTPVRYLDTTPLAGSAQIGSYVSSRSEKKP